MSVATFVPAATFLDGPRLSGLQRAQNQTWKSVGCVQEKQLCALSFENFLSCFIFSYFVLDLAPLSHFAKINAGVAVSPYHIVIYVGW